MITEYVYIMSVSEEIKTEHEDASRVLITLA